jgi:16S rRNA (uracil1498-N3)-methyltransferase
MRIFVPALAAGELTIRGDEHHYLARVRRAAVGDSLELLDGEGLRADATITTIGDTESTLAVGPVQQVVDLPPRIRALLPLIKGDRMDTALEKLVETGVDDIVVWPAARAVVKLDNERRSARIEHYQSIAQAAARQSGRASVPTVAWAESLAAAVATCAGTGARLALDPAADRTDLRAALARPATSSLPFDGSDARAFDESTDIAVTGRFRRPEASPPEHSRDPDDVTSTGRFVRVGTNPQVTEGGTTDWPSADTGGDVVSHVSIVTGPEGGLTPTELDALTAAGFTTVGLGPRVLRAETAPAVIVALVRALTRS